MASALSPGTAHPGLSKGQTTMENTFKPIDIDELDRVTGGSGSDSDTPTPVGGDGESIARLDQRFPPLEDELKGKTKGEG